MPVNPDIIFILLYFQKKVYRQSVDRRQLRAVFFRGQRCFYYAAAEPFL